MSDPEPTTENVLDLLDKYKNNPDIWAGYEHILDLKLRIKELELENFNDVWNKMTAIHTFYEGTIEELETKVRNLERRIT